MENSWVSYKKLLSELFVPGLFSQGQRYSLEKTGNGIFSLVMRSYQSCVYMKYKLEKILP